MKNLSVLIIGYGEMGHAMQYLLKGQKELIVYERNPKDHTTPIVLEDAVSKADVLLFCLPVNPHREIIQRITPYLKQSSLCVSIAKGLDETGQTAAQVFEDVLGTKSDTKNNYALLYGPMISEEIRAGRPAFAQLACDLSSYNIIRYLYSGTRLYIEHSHDIHGISWSVVLKNVYALIFGMSDELMLGDNMRGYLAVAALRELDAIVRVMGGQETSSYHLAGLGDLITTATSEDSHHHELGRMLAKETKEGIEGEGVHTLAMVSRHSLLNLADYPLFELIHNIVKQPNQVGNKITNYLNQVFSC